MTDKIDLDSGLLSILKTENFNKFTILELRSAYLAISHDKDLHKTEARRFVYRHILRLEKNGLLKRIHSKKTDKTTYAKTEKFDTSKFNAINQPLVDEAELNLTETDSPSKNLLQSLIDKLQGYKVELLINIGETDEYKSLCLEYPQLKEQLQESYNLARENNRKIIGNVKALEKTIELQKQDLQA
jgi:hypothetical protein